MNTCKISICIIVAILVSLPITAANTEHGQDTEMTSITKMKILVYTDYSGEDASGVREDIDQWNNSDGTVTTDDVETYKEVLDSLLSEQKCVYFLDGKRGYYDSIEYVIHNAEGSTESTENLTIATEWTVIFPKSSSNTHDIRISEPFNDPGTRYVITCPPGYRFISSQGLKDVKITEDSRTIEATLTDRPITLSFTDQVEEKDSPSFTILTAITTLLITAQIFKKVEDMKQHDI